jgi:hypothetical protein
LLKGFAANRILLEKIIITNTDTANITPKLNLHNTARSGEDDEYIQLAPEITLSAGQRLVYESSLQFLANQDLEIELTEEPETNQPQYIMVTENV